MAEAEVKACCLVSELLEEAGLDRRRARALKRQVLEGLILFCRWQLERMGPESFAASASVSAIAWSPGD